MTETCGHPAPDEIKVHRLLEEDEEPRPGWYIVQIGTSSAQGDVLEDVSPVLQRSLEDTGIPARAVMIGDLEDPDCGHTWTEVDVRPADLEEDAEPDPFLDL